MEEFKVRAAPKIAGKKNNIFKLHKDDQVTWTEAKMRRENDYQPWQIKLGSGRAARRFKAIKEGGVGENASYFVFYKPKDSSDSYEVCPIDEWYNVSATQRYKTLTAEEAEQKFEQRHKTLNLFSVMHLKKNGEAGEEAGMASDSKAFKVSELDDWNESGDDFDGSEDENGTGENESKRKNRKKKVKDESENAPEEGKEDSDEGDFEQREVDYMSDSSSDSSKASEDIKEEGNVKGIAEEEALRDLLSTDDEEDAEGGSPQKSNSRNTLGTVGIKQDDDAEGSDESSDSDDYDVDEDKMDSLFDKKSLPAQLVAQSGQDSDQARHNNGSLTNSSSVSATRRKVPDDETPSTSGSQSSPQQQQQQQQQQPPPSRRPRPADSQEKVIEDLVKKYLRRKPLPLKVLLKDIRAKLKRQGAANTEGDLVETIAVIMRRLDPVKQKINEVTYFSLPN